MTFAFLAVGRGRNHDPRYRALQRREVRESLRIEIVLIVALVAGEAAVLGPKPLLTDIGAVGTIAAALVLIMRREIIHRWPQESAIFCGLALDLLIASALFDAPDKSALVVASYGLMIVTSGTFTTLDVRFHLVFLAVSLAIWLAALAFAPIDQETRVQGAVIAVAASILSAAGSDLIQRRRERTFLSQTMVRLERRELLRTVRHLEAAMATIATLEGVLPICAHCKRIRDGDVWVRVETYVEERSSAQFSHGICPECTDRYYPGLLGEP